jgi:hypothetical protein
LVSWGPFFCDLNYDLLKNIGLNYVLIKSKKLELLQKHNAVFSHWEVLQNLYPYLEIDKNIVVSALSDAIFDVNFFETIISLYKPNFSGTSWPQINYRCLDDYVNNKKYNVYNSNYVPSELLYPLHQMISDVYFLDGNIMLDELWKRDFSNCEVYGAYGGIIQPLWLSAFNKKRINKKRNI